MRKSKSEHDSPSKLEDDSLQGRGHDSSTERRADDEVFSGPSGHQPLDNKSKEITGKTSPATTKRGLHKTAGRTPQSKKKSKLRSGTPTKAAEFVDGKGIESKNDEIQPKDNKHNAATPADTSHSQSPRHTDEIRDFKQIAEYLDACKFPPHEIEKLFKSPMKKRNSGSTAGHTPPPRRRSPKSLTPTPTKLRREKPPASDSPAPVSSVLLSSVIVSMAPISPEPVSSASVPQPLDLHISISIPASTDRNEAVPESSGDQPISHIFIKVDPPTNYAAVNTDESVQESWNDNIEAQGEVRDLASSPEIPPPPPPPPPRGIDLCTICSALPHLEQMDVRLDQRVIPPNTLRSIWNMLSNLMSGQSQSSRISIADSTDQPRMSNDEEISTQENVHAVSALEYVKHKTKFHSEQFLAKLNKLPVLETKPEASRTARSTLLHVFGTKQWWLLLILFCATHAFSFCQPIWDKTNAEFVRRHYDLTGVGCDYACGVDDENCPCVGSNDTITLTQKNVNDFVQVLHSIIAKEGCQKLELDSMATNFEDDGPIIPNSIIIDDLRRSFSYTPERAKLVIRLCKTLFYSSTFDVVIAREKGFIYLNDSLMKYCGYKFDFCADALLFGILFILIYILHLPLRLVFDNYVRPELRKIIRRRSKKD